MINIEEIFSPSAKLKNHKWVEGKIREYVIQNKYISFKGLLLFMGVLPIDLQEANEERHINKNLNKSLKYLEMFKLKFESKLEEYLIYQGQHEDMKDCKFFDYKTLKLFIINQYYKQWYRHII